MSARVLQRPALVLNRNWQPIHVATVARAILMLYGGTVRVVDPEDYQTYDWEDWARLHPRTTNSAFARWPTVCASRKSWCWLSSTACLARPSPSVAVISTNATGSLVSTAVPSRQWKI